MNTRMSNFLLQNNTGLSKYLCTMTFSKTAIYVLCFYCLPQGRFFEGDFVGERVGERTSALAFGDYGDAAALIESFIFPSESSELKPPLCCVDETASPLLFGCLLSRISCSCSRTSRRTFNSMLSLKAPIFQTRVMPFSVSVDVFFSTQRPVFADCRNFVNIVLFERQKVSSVNSSGLR